jgi:1-acyl-sn-glycerol-3-phosphate acyltransferase
VTLIRSAVFNLYFVLATLGYGVVGLFVRAFAPQRALWLATAWVRALLGGARLICGIRVVVIGRENLPDGPALIASQHQSAFDTLVWLMIVPRVSYVFKAELAKIPLFGPMLRPAGQIPLDRGASFAAIKSLLRGAEKAVAEQRQIVIFPEGTRVEPGQVVPLRPGIAALASRTGLPVIPVATDSGMRWGRRAFRKRAGPIHLVIGAPIPPGLGQAGLLDTLRASWRDAELQMKDCG